jgi:two-component system LytT family response regulator
MNAPIRILIVDDEPLARRSIRALLEGDRTVSIAGECASGDEALDALRAGGIDLVFLDIQMPGATGLDVLAQLDPASLPAIIFVTAFDAYAVRAFEVRSVDYLLKPYSDERFSQALERAKSEIALRDTAATQARLLGLLEELRASSAPRSPHGYLTRLLLRSTGRVLMVALDDVDWIEADGDYARLTAAGKQHLLRETFAELEYRLDPEAFVRIHRSYIVRIDRIRELRPQSNGDYRIYLRDGTQLPLSRTYREQVLARLGGSPA